MRDPFSFLFSCRFQAASLSGHLQPHTFNFHKSINTPVCPCRSPRRTERGKRSSCFWVFVKVRDLAETFQVHMLFSPTGFLYSGLDLELKRKPGAHTAWFIHDAIQTTRTGSWTCTVPLRFTREHNLRRPNSARQFGRSVRWKKSITSKIQRLVSVS